MRVSCMRYGSGILLASCIQDGSADTYASRVMLTSMWVHVGDAKE